MMHDLQKRIIPLVMFHQIFALGLTLKSQQTWDDAMKNCRTVRGIVSPHSFVYNNVTVFKERRRMWSANYILYIPCHESTDICQALYVEHTLGNISYQSLCYQDSKGEHLMVDAAKKFTDTCSIAGHKHSMLKLNSMEVLKKMTASMKYKTKYWIDGVDMTFDQKAEVIRYCELYSKYSNTTIEKQRSDCDVPHPFSCISGQHYHTAISLITFPELINNSQPTYLESLQNQDVSWNQIVGTVTAVFVIVGLIVIGCLLKRWIKQMKNQIIEHFRQKYDNRMYDNEPQEFGPEAEVLPDTPLSPGSSIYDNIANVNIGSHLFRDAGFEEIGVTRTNMHRVVAMPQSVNIDNRPRLTIPKNTPSRENAVRQKSSDITPKPGKPPRQNCISKTYSSVSCPANTSCVEESGTSGIGLRKNTEQESLKLIRKPSPKPNIKFTETIQKADVKRLSKEEIVPPKKTGAAFYVNKTDRAKMKQIDSDKN